MTFRVHSSEPLSLLFLAIMKLLTKRFLYKGFGVKCAGIPVMLSKKFDAKTSLVRDTYLRDTLKIRNTLNMGFGTHAQISF